MKQLFAIIFATISFSVFAAWELNDVSYLYPLNPQSMLTPKMSGNKGELLPFSMSKYFESDLIVNVNRPKSSYAILKSVGVRIDNCFKFTSNIDEKCSKQVRIVWQPVTKDEDKKFTTFDAAIHTFYNLTNSEFKQLTLKLQKLKEKYSLNTTKLPIQVHPGFKLHLKNKQFAKDLNNIILSYCGFENMARLTFMKMVTQDIWWSFGGVDRTIKNNWAPIKIPRMVDSDTKQDFFNDGFDDPVGMRGSIVPSMPAKKDNLTPLLIGLDFYNEDLKLEAFKNAVNTWNRILNPKNFDTTNLDCVHCHIASVTRTWAEAKFASTLKKTDINLGKYSQAFANRHNLKNVTDKKDTTKSLRSFGYFNHVPFINERAINESAEVADSLNSKGK